MAHQPTIDREISGGVQKLYRFPNARGASVIRHQFSYGSEQGLWELAVIRYDGPGDWEWELDYTTPLTDDVIGRLTWEQIEELLDKIAEMPSDDMKEAA